jgi:chaperone LolA
MTHRSLTVGLLSLLALGACGGADTAGEPRAERPPQPAAAAAAQPAATEMPGGPDGAAPAYTATAAPQAEAPQPAASGTPAPGAAGAPPAPAPGAPAQPPAAAPTPQQAADANAILQRAERAQEAIRSMEAEFVQDVSIPLLNQTQRSRGTLFHRRPDRFLMRFSDPEGDIIVADGRHLWMYYPSTDPRQVIRTAMAQGGQQVDLHREFLSNATERYAATLTGTESVAGRAAHVLVLTPRGPSPYQRIRVWVDQQDALVRQFEITEENDSVRRLELRNLRLNHALPDQLFRFTPPPGAQVFDH